MTTNVIKYTDAIAALRRGYANEAAAVEQASRDHQAALFYASVGWTPDGSFSPGRATLAPRLALAYAERIGSREHLCAVDRAEKWSGGVHDATCDQWPYLGFAVPDGEPWYRALLVDARAFGCDGECYVTPRTIAPSAAVEDARYIAEHLRLDPRELHMIIIGENGPISDEDVIADLEAP